MLNADRLESFCARFLDEINECNDFIEYINAFSKEIGDISANSLPNGESTISNEYLFDPLSDFFSNPGKCSRSLCCLLANFACDGKVIDCIRPALAIEIFQNGALIHDDIADHALTRRNKPCMHVTHGTEIALNAGDFALTFMDEFVLNDDLLDSSKKLEVMLELAKMKTKTIEGQAIDIGWEKACEFDQSEENYETMATLKTANYTCASPFAIGATVANASHEVVRNLRSAGLKCGLAFQIQDDILNVDKSAKDKSKDFALDIAEGKHTLIALHALKTLNETESNELRSILLNKNNNEEDLARALDLIEQSNAIEYAKQRTEKLITEAKGIISTSLKDGQGKTLLMSMADWCLERTH